MSKIDVITFPNNIVKEIKFFSVEETAPCIEIYLQTTEAILYGNQKNTQETNCITYDLSDKKIVGFKCKDKEKRVIYFFEPIFSQKNE